MASLPNTATKAERLEAHRNKMAWKADLRARRYTVRGPGIGDAQANLSRKHPDYGCTPAEHMRRKAARLSPTTGKGGL